VMKNENGANGQQIPKPGHNYTHKLHHLKHSFRVGGLTLESNIHIPFVDTFNTERSDKNTNYQCQTSGSFVESITVKLS